MNVSIANNILGLQISNTNSRGRELAKVTLACEVEAYASTSLWACCKTRTCKLLTRLASYELAKYGHVKPYIVIHGLVL